MLGHDGEMTPRPDYLVCCGLAGSCGKRGCEDSGFCFEAAPATRTQTTAHDSIHSILGSLILHPSPEQRTSNPLLVSNICPPVKRLPFPFRPQPPHYILCCLPVEHPVAADTDPDLDAPLDFRHIFSVRTRRVVTRSIIIRFAN